MQARGGGPCALAVLTPLAILATLGPARATAQVVAVEESILQPPGAGARSSAGAAIAIDGDTALVGVPGAFGGAPGVVYSFVRSGGMWTLDQTIANPDTDTTGDNFGSAIALSGTTAVIGAPGDGGGAHPGAAWLLERTGMWVATRLERPTGTPGQFGHSVALSASQLAVGAPATDTGTVAGAVVLYQRDGSMPVSVTHVDAEADDLFGASVALSDSALLVGAPGDDRMGTNAGAAYPFDLAGVAGTPLRPASTSDFGRSVALDAAGLVAAIGAPADGDSGAVYVLRRGGGTSRWPDVSLGARLTGSHSSPSDEFGTTVALEPANGDLVVGAPLDEDSAMDAGSAYLFRIRAMAYVEVARFHAGTPTATDHLGTSVAVSGETAIAGATGPMDANGFVAVFPFPRADGATCGSAGRCESGNCIDGFCCDTACGGDDPSDCTACSVSQGSDADGHCGPVRGGLSCMACGAAGMCASGMCSAASSCDAGPPPGSDAGSELDGSAGAMDGGSRPHVQISGCKCEVGGREGVPGWAFAFAAALIGLAARRRLRAAKKE